MKKLFDFKNLNQIQEDLSNVKSSTEAVNFLAKYNFPTCTVAKIGTKEKLVISLVPSFWLTEPCFTITIMSGSKGTMFKIDTNGNSISKVEKKETELSEKKIKIKFGTVRNGISYTVKDYSYFNPKYNGWLSGNILIKKDNSIHITKNDKNVIVLSKDEEEISLTQTETLVLERLLRNKIKAKG